MSRNILNLGKPSSPALNFIGFYPFCWECINTPRKIHDSSFKHLAHLTPTMGFTDNFFCSVTSNFRWKFMWWCIDIMWSGNHFHSLSISLPFPMFPLLFLNLPYFTLFTLSNTFSQWWRDRTLDNKKINNPFPIYYNKKNWLRKDFCCWLLSTCISEYLFLILFLLWM